MRVFQRAERAVKHFAVRCGLRPAKRSSIQPPYVAVPAPPRKIRGSGSSEYEQRVASQIEQYKDGFDAYELPGIFHYWARKYLRPRIGEIFGVASMPDFFAKPMAALAQRAPDAGIAILSLGSGDCTVEIGLAKALQAMGVTRFTITATELSPSLLDRARQAIDAEGLVDRIICQETDLNSWTCEVRRFDAALACHSLHHIENLEHVFSNLRRGLKPGAVFVVADMIGRNGHMRWPETLELMNTIWARLPETHKYNRLLLRHEPHYINHDCSTEGFEGIRAQDILPLLLTQFHPGKFFAFGGVPDVFLDRAFGHNFAPGNAADCAFIDEAQEINDAALVRGDITPTQMMAYFHLEPAEIVTWANVTPVRSVRRASRD